MCQSGLDAPADAHVPHDRHTPHEHEESGAEDLCHARLDVALKERLLLRVLMVVPSIARGHREEICFGLR